MFSMKTWDEESSDEATLKFASELAKKFFARLGSEDCYSQYLEDSDYSGLLKLSPPISSGAEAYRNYAAGIGLLKKLPCLPLSVDPKLAAVEKFLQGEAKCRETNLIFNLWKRGEFQFPPVVESILHASQRKIQAIVGFVPDVSDVRFRFSPGGASTSTKKKDSEIRTLIANMNHCSEELISDPLLGEVLRTVPLLSSFFIEEDSCPDSFLMSVNRSRLDFVPKDASTDRIITVEPDMNKFIQNGYGDVLRLRAKRAGIDLTDQSRNQELARIGSLNNSVATVDLTNASGLLALGLIEHLWPPEWFDVLMSIRSGYTLYEKSFIFHMSAYAGMGNGTTFPVESITFFALAQSVVEHLGIVGPVSAYGDDIIIPSGAYSLLGTVFKSLGLEVNPNKSFSHGPFRESCGSDWFSGYSVRPAFLRGNVSFRRLFLLHNHFYRLGDFEAAEWFLDFIPSSFRVFGPDGFGDGHLLGVWSGKVYYHETEETVLKQGSCVCTTLGLPHGSECYHRRRVRTRTSMYTFETYSYRARSSYFVSKVDFLLPSYTVYARSNGFRLTEYSGQSTIVGDGKLATRIEKSFGMREPSITDRHYTSLRFHGNGPKRKPLWHELPPDSSVWVIGTPMPGALGCRRHTVCTFEQPTGHLRD